jgi:hypothetical protein
MFMCPVLTEGDLMRGAAPDFQMMRSPLRISHTAVRLP